MSRLGRSSAAVSQHEPGYSSRSDLGTVLTPKLSRTGTHAVKAWAVLLLETRSGWRHPARFMRPTWPRRLGDGKLLRDEGVLMVNGRFLDRAALDKLLAQAEAAASKKPE